MERLSCASTAIRRSVKTRGVLQLVVVMCVLSGCAENANRKAPDDRAADALGVDSAAQADETAQTARRTGAATDQEAKELSGSARTTWAELYPEAAEDLRRSFPIKDGMSRADVNKVIRESEGKSLESDYVLIPLKDRGAGDVSALQVAGRESGFCVVFFRRDRVRTVWFEWASPAAIVGRPFVLSGDEKFPVDPVPFFPHDADEAIE